MQARAHSFFQNGTLLPYPALSATLPNHNIPFYKYLQLRHLFQSPHYTSPWHRELTSFELLCSSTEPQGHLISVNYSLLFSQRKVKDDKIVRQWENDLSIDLTPMDWDHIFTLIHKGSINVSTQENRYKLFSKWYRTPDKVHHFHPSIPPICWRCNATRGTLLHIWWECNLIQPFWSEIHWLISQITTYSLAFSPTRYLLHHTPSPPVHTKNPKLYTSLTQPTYVSLPCGGILLPPR